jgi:hypothetical protein
MMMMKVVAAMDFRESGMIAHRIVPWHISSAQLLKVKVLSITIVTFAARKYRTTARQRMCCQYR